jgi:1-acyl-sn-glycerol-3-phosphate acyltransferase
LRTFKEAISWLKKGVPIMAFPEGMRSRDGRLMEFKGGLFSMAIKCQVPIIPITLSHTHAVMPANSLFPVQAGAGILHVHVHAPIDTADKTDVELEHMVRLSFLGSLPLEQRPRMEPLELQLLLHENALAMDDAFQQQCHSTVIPHSLVAPTEPSELELPVETAI